MVFVWMKLQSKLSISFFQIFITSIFGNSKYFIVIFTFVYAVNKRVCYNENFKEEVYVIALMFYLLEEYKDLFVDCFLNIKG